MQQTRTLDGTVARGVLSLATAVALALTLAASALLAMPSQDESGGPDTAQAIIAYSFLRHDYLGFNRLLASSASLPMIQNLRSLDAALKSLHCDIPTRMAFGSRQEVTALASVPMGRWINSPRPSRGSLGTWLFVMKPPGHLHRGVLVVFSTEGPRQTTVFRLRRADKGYQARLLLDSFKKGSISNDATQVGAVTTIKFESDNLLLLKDWGEPGIGPPEFTRVRRVFRLNLSTDVVTEVTSGAPGRH